MGFGDIVKKAAVGTAKVAGSAFLGTVGVASSVVEALGAGSNIELVETIGHGLKSASFNGVRRMWGKESMEYDHSAGDAGRRKAEEIRRAQGQAAWLTDEEPDIETKHEKSVAEWDREWFSIGMLKTADLSPYAGYVGLYRHVINGKTMYVGRAIEVNNGGFRKRLSDYRRESDSARKHSSGRTIHEHLDEIETYILIVGDDAEAVATTKRLEGEFVRKYHPEWNRQINI